MGELLSFSWSFLERRCRQNISEGIVNHTPLVAWPISGCIFLSGVRMGLWYFNGSEWTGLMWLPTFGWIPGVFISFCTETCGAVERPGEIYHFRWVKENQREKVIDPVGNSQSHIPGQLSTMPPPLPSVHPQGASILIIHKRGRCAGLLHDLSGLDKGQYLVSDHLLGLLSLCHTLKIMEIRAVYTSEQNYPECVLGFQGSAAAHHVSKCSWGRRYIIQCPDSPSKPSPGRGWVSMPLYPGFFYSSKKAFLKAVLFIVSAFPHPSALRLPLIAPGGCTFPHSPLWWEEAAREPRKGGTWRSTTPQGQLLLCYADWHPAAPNEQGFPSPGWFRWHLLHSDCPALLISFWSHEPPCSHSCREADSWDLCSPNLFYLYCLPRFPGSQECLQGRPSYYLSVRESVENVKTEVCCYRPGFQGF